MRNLYSEVGIDERSIYLMLKETTSGSFSRKFRKYPEQVVSETFRSIF